MVSVNYLNVAFCKYFATIICMYLIVASMKETLPNWVVSCSVCLWVACACSKCEKLRRGWRCQFQICAILKHHNSIHHAHCVPVPSAFRYLWIFASSIFSFLNLSYNIKRWSRMYSLFLELLRCLMSKVHILSYCCWHKTGA